MDSLLSASQAGVAQLVEQRIRNAKVVGSTPISGTICTANARGEADPNRRVRPERKAIL